MGKRYYTIVFGTYLGIALVYFILFSLPPMRTWIAALTDLENRDYRNWGNFPLLCAAAALGGGAVFFAVTQRAEKKLWGSAAPLQVSVYSVCWNAALILLAGGWLTRRITEGLMHGVVDDDMLIHFHTTLTVQQDVFAGEIVAFMMILTAQIVFATVKRHKGAEPNRDNQ